MSLWIAVLWVGFTAMCLATFVLCRKCVADIAHEVAEEMNHRLRKILEAERAIDDRLVEAFSSFQNPAEAVQEYKTAQATIEGIPRTNPSWKWTADDLEQMRKRTEAKETARRCRPSIVASIIVILALTVAAATTTVILSNSVQPVLAAQALPAAPPNPPVSSLPPPANLPTLPPLLPMPIQTPGPANPLSQPTTNPASSPVAPASCPATPSGGDENV